MHCYTAAQNCGQWLNQSHFGSMVEVSFPPSVNIRTRASASREGTNILNQRIYSDFFVLSVVFVNFALKVHNKENFLKLTLVFSCILWSSEISGSLGFFFFFFFFFFIFSVTSGSGLVSLPSFFFLGEVGGSGVFRCFFFFSLS